MSDIICMCNVVMKGFEQLVTHWFSSTWTGLQSKRYGFDHFQ